jgi:hypothetical protein
MKTIYRRESKAATKREFLPASRVVGIRTGAGGRRLVVEPRLTIVWCTVTVTAR